ncbi:hypothetical protein EMCRGX_G018463 [Ephydatia muelleri]
MQEQPSVVFAVYLNCRWSSYLATTMVLDQQQMVLEQMRGLQQMDLQKKVLHESTSA